MTIVVGVLAFGLIILLAAVGSAGVRRYCKAHGHRPRYNEDQQAVQCLRCGEFL